MLYLFTELLVHLHLSEQLGLFLGSHDFLLKLNLLTEVFLLQFAQIADLLQLLLVASKRLAHGQLVLVAAGATCATH